MRDIDDFDSNNMVQRGENVFTRICTGYIDSVDELNGTVIVSMEDFIGVRGSVELSFDYVSSVGAGWIRFMPSIGDKVLCGFRPNNQIEILRYKAISYSQMAQFAADSNPPFLFRTLKPGEFELMSVGYAEIWGSRSGKLHLAGGLATIDLDAPTNQNTQNAILHTFISPDGTQFNLGAIRRVNPLKTTLDNSEIAPGIPNKEYKITLIQSIAGVAQTLYDATVGKVMDYAAGVFTPRIAPDTGLNLIADINYYTPDGIQKIQIRADEGGNLRMDLPATATDGLRIISTLGSLLANMLNVKLTAAAEMDLVAGAQLNISSSVAVHIDAPLITAGGNTGNVLTNTTAISDFTGNFIQVGNPNFKSV